MSRSLLMTSHAFTFYPLRTTLLATCPYSRHPILFSVHCRAVFCLTHVKLLVHHPLFSLPRTHWMIPNTYTYLLDGQLNAILINTQLSS
ncbi:hypothetical protein F5Y13DRAFT_58928 [Hypoxylon sp. FL1857]|nr:hypothetical protein F5Y13DRAFT_58928 [Hypoxylon sp. FL1857]